MTRNLLYVFLIAVCSSMGGCGNDHPDHKYKLQEGDLLFQDLNCGELCDAIEAVTNGIDGKKFSHCAMLVKVNDSLEVAEAIGKNVHFTSIRNFFERSGDTGEIKNITVARIKPQFQSLIARADEYAIHQEGVSYDDEFALDNGKLYCSELIYEAFRAADNNHDFFQLAPMTFRQPGSNNFFPAWIKYFQELNKPVPEGKQGINPGLISLSPKLEFIKIENIK